MRQTIITPVSKDGVIPSASILVEESEFGLFLKDAWRFIQGIFALIGLYTVLGWII